MVMARSQALNLEMKLFIRYVCYQYRRRKYMSAQMYEALSMARGNRRVEAGKPHGRRTSP